MGNLIYVLARIRRIFHLKDIAAARDFINITNNMHVRTTVNAAKLMDANAHMRGVLVDILDTYPDLTNRQKAAIKRAIST